MLANDLLDTPLIILPGMDDEEIETLWQQTYQRAKMTQAFLDREIDIETYFDFMAQAGYEPCDLLDAAEENLDFAMQQELVLER
ncbi:MAG: hypothetical protein KME45_32825 [Stenomitos rutilans HA7619-LM2]|jgi:hypothetical protein|nr:hypothetical protein [Stenomitos rutilans HA7619-LM2]